MNSADPIMVGAATLPGHTTLAQFQATILTGIGFTGNYRPIRKMSSRLKLLSAQPRNTYCYSFAREVVSKNHDRDFITWWYDRWHHPVA